MVQAKKSVERLKPYVNASQSHKLYKNHRKILKLDANEASISPSPQVIAAMMQYLQEGPINWYPDVESFHLCEQLSHYTGLPKENILTFNGSDHGLETVARTFLTEGDEVIHFQPTYDHFRVYAETCDARMIPIEEGGDESFFQKVFNRASANTRIVYFVNPNNPTGHMVGREGLIEALQRLPNIIFICDEAYFEFCEITMADLIPQYKNLIVSRSFSKAFGLAGLRCGYIMSQPEILTQVNKVRVGKNINAVAQVAAAAALEDLYYMQRYVDDVKSAKRWVVKQLERIGLSVKDTPANFVLFKVEEPAKVLKYLELNYIYIRDRSYIPELKGFIRLTIGDPLTMKRFWKIFETTPAEWLFGESAVKPSFWEKDRG